jgi:hypothetical protein
MNLRVSLVNPVFGGCCEHDLAGTSGTLRWCAMLPPSMVQVEL